MDSFFLYLNIEQLFANSENSSSVTVQFLCCRCADGLRVTLAHMATYVPIVVVMLGNPILYLLSYNKCKLVTE